jgi:glycosyltransferase involved in cell wall biosynthesis
MPKYSVVVTFHDREDSVATLYSRLVSVMEETGESFELVFVDDGSRDGTTRLLEEIAAIDRRVIVIRLRRYFGLTSALAAGFDHAQGEFVICMDSDLRHNPEDIPLFIEKLNEGHGIVSGWPRLGEKPWPRRVSAWFPNWIMAKLSGVWIHDFGTSFRAYRREVLQQVPLYGDMHRTLPALASWHGISVSEVEVHFQGDPPSAPKISSTFKLFFDLLIVRFLLRYIGRPLHFFGGMGLLAVTAGGSVGGWLAIRKILDPNWDVLDVHGPLVVFAAVLIVAGAELLAMGLLAEMNVRYYHEPARKIPYAVELVLRSKDGEQSVTSD